MRRTLWTFKKLFPKRMSTSRVTRMGTLSEFLSSSKTSYLEDVKAQNTGGWTVVMGNEAGGACSDPALVSSSLLTSSPWVDLDSIACSLAYSYLATHLHNRKTVALIQTPRKDLSLRPENLYALQDLTKLNIETDILCIDDYPESFNPASISSFALVDHNSLLPKFRGGEGKVVSIIDHHVDEGQHLDVPDDERVIVNPCGSCASLVAKHFQLSWVSKPNVEVPPEVATLLLTAIHIDTAGLKEGDKGTPIDKDANYFLAGNSTFVSNIMMGPPDLSHLHKELSSRKHDVSHLSTYDLLRRDYKQFNFSGLEVGLSTVPQGLKATAKKDDKFWESLDGYVKEKELAILGVLTTFKSEKKKKKRREQLWLLNPTLVSSDVENRFFEGLDQDKEMDLEKKDDFEVAGEQHAGVYNQNNTDATRKQIAPLAKKLLEG